MSSVSAILLREMMVGSAHFWRTDMPETYVDAPISLQLVGRRYEDEKVVEALEMILEVAGKA